MTEINKLINKYYNPIGQDLTANHKKTTKEQYTNEYDKKQKTEAKRRYRHGILQDLTREIPIELTNQQITQIEYWIDRFNDNFKQFHRQASNETIILAFIMIQAKKVNTKLQIEDYTICDKYNLNNNKFITIQNQLIFMLMKTTPLTYNQAMYLDHEILMKGEQR